ncbi:MAG TPA: cob(I)yrinic acid a,c-diamide adenosyltransferase [Spirochaetia bacterium]|nr:cob(I)yrinic acid a,c-diamide adenosyltransferase [Spirochaetia bacterium]
MKIKEGLVYVFEGYGKGKTSAALGVTVRMLLNKKKVVWISWYKEKSWKISEMKLPKTFQNDLKMYWIGKGFYGGPIDHDTPDGHKNAAISGILLAKSVLFGKEGTGGMVDLLVLDEVLRAVNDRLLTIEDVLEIVKMRDKTHVVLTGHDCPREIKEIADLVTEMKKIKHPYDKGVLAVSGLDF